MAPRQRRGRHSAAWLAVLLIGCTVVAPLAAQQNGDLDPEKVRRALDRAVDYLKRQQNLNGSWSAFQSWDTTPLVALALLNAGVPASDNTIRKALQYLREREYDKVYLVSLQTMVFCAADPDSDLNRIQRNVKWLVDRQLPHGGWAYPAGNGDNSNSQFALLALWEADRVFERYLDRFPRLESPVPEQTWRKAQDYWKLGKQATPHGIGWGYVLGDSGASGSMTAAGVSSLVITADRLPDDSAQVLGGQAQCCGRSEQADEVQRLIDGGLRWLGNQFSVKTNPQGEPVWYHYYLYGLERVGRLTAQRFLYRDGGGKFDWYREGTAVLVDSQDASGFWRGFGRISLNNDVSTSLALLFLAKGRWPVLMSKLRYGGPQDDRWNHHPRDVLHLTRYIETAWQRNLTYQVIDSREATADDYLQSPVVFVSADESIDYLLQDERYLRLREYVDQGGFLFIERCCWTNQQGSAGAPPNDPVHLKVAQLLKRMFPESDLQPLDLSHPVYHIEGKVGGHYLGNLLGIHHSCRLPVVYCNKDLSCFWDLSRGRTTGPLPQAVREQVNDALQVGRNVLAYATGRELKYKFEIPASSAPRQPQDAVDRARLIIAKLPYPGEWNPAPQALVNLQREISRHLGEPTPPEQRHVQQDAQQAYQDLFDYHMVFLHGRASFQFTPQQREQLRQFVQRGGMVFADAVCSNEAFARSFRREMQEIFGPQGHVLQPIPAGHDLLSERFGGFKLDVVERRETAGAGQGVYRKVPPDLEGIRIDGRYGVIFSRYDLSCALESGGKSHCVGYSRDDAVRIGINVVLYSLFE
jgi:hypothetical protein